MPGTSTHVLHDVEAVAFVGNDVVSCRTYELGTDGVSVRAPVARGANSFVRLQCHLDPQHWLDVDAVLTECSRFGNEWHWHLSFVSVRAPPPVALAAFIHRHRRHVAPTVSPPAKPTSSAPPSPARAAPGEKADDLKALFREALHEVDGT